MSETKIPISHRKKTSRHGKKPARRTLAAKIKGKYAWIPYSSEDFNHDKHREIALEDRA